VTYLLSLLITATLLARSEIWSGVTFFAATARSSALALGTGGLFLRLRSLSNALKFFLQTTRKFEVVLIVLAKTVCRNPVVPSMKMKSADSSVSDVIAFVRLKTVATVQVTGGQGEKKMNEMQERSMK
jgi:hypothetical protein